jgi:hypothetical protein
MGPQGIHVRSGLIYPLALLFPLLENHFITIEMQIQIVVRYLNYKRHLYQCTQSLPCKFDLSTC